MADRSTYLQELRERLTLMWGYLRPLMGRGEMSPSGGNAAFIEGMDVIVARVTSGRSLRQLRSVVQDLEESLEGLSPEQVKEAHQLLAARFGGATLEHGDAAWRELIIKRGRIRTAEEQRLISVRIESIYDHPAHREELHTLNALLAEAATRAGKLPSD